MFYILAKIYEKFIQVIFEETATVIHSFGQQTKSPIQIYVQHKNNYFYGFAVQRENWFFSAELYGNHSRNCRIRISLHSFRVFQHKFIQHTLIIFVHVKKNARRCFLFCAEARRAALLQLLEHMTHEFLELVHFQRALVDCHQKHFSLF